MSALIGQAMESLSITCNISWLHPNDEDNVKSHLKALHKHGEDVSSASLRPLAEYFKWAPGPTKLLLKWGDTISDGGRVQIKNKQFVSSEKEIIEHLKNRISEKNS